MIDTNIVTAYFKRDAAVAARLDACQEILLSVVTLGETVFGAHRSPARDRILTRLNFFLPAVRLLPVEVETAWHYGQIKAALTTAGKIVPENDLWIAATALQHDLTFASRDQHFAVMPGLRWEIW